MTRDALIQKIKNEITEGCALPFAITDARIHQLIDDALNWFWTHYEHAVTTQRFLIPQHYFQTQDFKRTRRIQMPDCVVSVYEVREVKGYQKISYFGADFSAEKLIAQEIYLSPFNSDDLVLRTAYESYWDLSKAFFIDIVSFDYNHNTKVVNILGRDPKTATCITAYAKIPDESLFDDWYFQQYMFAKGRISLGRALGTISFNLPGGIAINAGDIKSDGETELDKIIEKIQSDQVADWMMIYH